MKTILAARCAKRDTWQDTERWARSFVASPARTAQDRRHREIVAALLTEAAGAR